MSWLPRSIEDWCVECLRSLVTVKRAYKVVRVCVEEAVHRHLVIYKDSEKMRDLKMGFDHHVEGPGAHEEEHG